ncbi:MAG: MarR family winged helix-turn-helix transcriptional regulator [Phenylobacterium sp.]|uniref:MarR family winged helix-turn-helix transcriptional regulator n=1 Tax=Phenylobacterium sp. TaxID=1871053 RepID=UPI00273677B8|nr:MarR family winged helix-turn-helix transcriptional regulator [Phenylobacterium sp.]MDP3175875.1 MarR family winged helix-turn-helix transcriptional regulator [Phenylobacterium sp.]
MTEPAVFACACATIRKAARAVSRLYDEALGDSGLTANQYTVLRYVSQLGEPHLSRLAEALVMDRTTLYRALQPMVSQGWLHIAPVGGRAKAARLTTKGAGVMKAATPAWEAVQQDFLDRIGAEEWRAISGGLRRAAELLRPPQT